MFAKSRAVQSGEKIPDKLPGAENVNEEMPHGRTERLTSKIIDFEVVLNNASSEFLRTRMATRKAAESTLYHVHPKGFWKKFRDAVVVNPEISSGLPIPELNRYPQPGSRPEEYSTPATKASDPAQNPYWKRDVRRAYPQLSVVTQSDLSTLLIQHSQPQSLAAPKEGDADKSPAKVPDAVDLTQAIISVASTSPLYNEAKLPPKLPASFKRWRPERAPDAPHDPDAYFPMLLYK